MTIFKTISKMAIVMLMFIFFTSTTSFGIPTYWNLGAIGGVPSEGDTNDQLTSVFDQIGYYANINTTQYDTDGDNDLSVGDLYTSHGNAIASTLIPVSSSDDEGMNTGYEFTFVLTELLGVVQEIQEGTINDTVINRYYGGTIDLYIDTAMDSDHSGTLDLGDDVGFGSGGATAVKVATVIDITGIGTSTFAHGTNDFLTGSYDISGVFDQILAGFWFTADGKDISDLTLFNFEWFIGTADGNIDKVEQYFATAGNSEYELYDIYSDSNASFEISPVPEPTTMLLLASSFLGIGMVGRKRNFLK